MLTLPVIFVIIKSSVRYPLTAIPIIANICDQYNVDFALSNGHVTVFSKTRNEAFIQDDRGSVSFINLSDVILKRAGVIDEKGNATVDNEQLLYSAATYIAAFYAAQSMPQGGMAAWGARDLKSFMARLDKMSPEDAVRSTRSIMVAKVPNDYKNEFIENVKAVVRKQNADAEEKRRQAYLNSEEHRHMQDPGWRGPNGTWSND